MARTSSNPRIVNRTVRAKLAVRRDPYWHLIAEGQHLGYRKTGEMQGTWIARLYTREQGRRFHAVGIADDSAPANERTVLSFQQALEAAQIWFGSLSYGDLAGVTSGPYTVGQAMNDYLAHLGKAKRKPQYRTSVIVRAHILPTLGTIELSKLTHGKVKAWRDALAEAAPRLRSKAGKPQSYRSVDADDANSQRKRQATANRVLTVLKAALNYAKGESRRIATDAAWVDVKPFAKVDVPKVRFLTVDEVNAIVGKCDADFQSLVKGALLTGCRYGELTSMTVADFNSKDGQVYIAESKNGESRYVDLNEAGIEFCNHLASERKPNETLFQRSNGKAWKTSEQFRPMNAACDAAKVEGVNFHILRHTYASHALMTGMTIEVLAQQLGHKDTRITMRHYAHLCPTFKQESVRRNAPSFGFSVKPGPLLVTKTA
jgi:integrase